MSDDLGWEDLGCIGGTAGLTPWSNTTPLGKDVVLLEKITGSEELSGSFQIGVAASTLPHFLSLIR